MERKRIEEFTRDGKNFIYVDLSDYKTTEEFDQLIGQAHQLIVKYPPHSLYTMANIENTRLDLEVKELITKFMEQDEPYVKYGAIVGIDGVQKLISNMIFKDSKRANMIFAFTKEQAIELLLKKE